MDRRQQRRLALVAVALLLACLTPVATAQEASPSPSPVAASPTPGPTATPRPTPTIKKTPPPVSPTARPTEALKPPAAPTPAVGDAEDPAREAAARMAADRRARRQEIERFLDGKGGEGPMARMLERLPPGEDREAFRRNLIRWRDLPPQERDALRGQVDDRGERIKAETENAIRESGLRLSADQRDVFALRYVQERRKLERALLDQMNAERARRLPRIVEQLTKEFPQAAPPTPTPTAHPSPTPTLAPTIRPSATPHVSPAPHPSPAASPAPSAAPAPTAAP